VLPTATGLVTGYARLGYVGVGRREPVVSGIADRGDSFPHRAPQKVAVLCGFATSSGGAENKSSFVAVSTGSAPLTAVFAYNASRWAEEAAVFWSSPSLAALHPAQARLRELIDALYRCAGAEAGAWWRRGAWMGDGFGA